MLSTTRPARLARACILAAFATLSACGGGSDGGDGGTLPTTPPPPAAPVTVEMVAAAANLSVGGSLQLQASVSGSSNTGISWTSSASDVVSVSASGTITAIRTGIATITARANADANKTATTAVAVYASQGTAVTSGSALSNLSGAEDSQKLYRITVPVGATQLEVVTSGGSGDLDLYLRPGQPPANGGIACASEGDFTVERCVVQNPTPGDWYILLLGYEAYSGVSMTATSTAGSGGSGGGSGNTLSIALAASPASLSVVRGTSGSTSIAVTRNGGFTGGVALTLEGAPTGVTASFAPATIASGTTASALTVSVASTVAAGSYTLTVRGKSAGLADATTAVALTVTASGSGGGTGGGTGSVQFASSRLLVPPGFPNGGGLVNLTATNEGAYVEFLDASEKAVVARFQTGGTDRDWITFNTGLLLGGWAPVSLTQERASVFSVYWAENPFSCNYAAESPTQSGMYNINTGTAEFRWVNDLCVETFVPSADETQSLRTGWAIAEDGTIYREKAAKTGNKLSGSYEKVATIAAHRVGAAHPTASSLYVGAASKLYEVPLTGTGIARSWDLSAFGGGLLGVNKLRFVGSTLWIGYENKLLRLGTDGQVKEFAPGVGIGAFGSFCVQGGNVYLSDGNKIEIATGTKRTWIADREVSQLTSQADIQKYMDIFGAVAGGMVDCSPSRSAIYVTGPKGLYEIVPK